MWQLHRTRETAEQLDGLCQPAVDYDEGKQTVEQIELAQQPSSPPQHGPIEDSGPPVPYGATLTAAPSFVYALGHVDARFPSLALEKEFAQVTGRTDTAGKTDRQTIQTILADRANRYLARQMCWVFTIEGLETYLLIPRDPADLELLIDAVRPRSHPSDIDVVIGVHGPIAPPEACNGLMVPIVAFDQLYSFDRDELIQQIPRPEKLPKDKEEQFEATAGELFVRIMQMADNAGATDEHRALNYLVVRYPAIYARAAEAHGGESALTAVDVRPSQLGGSIRKIVDVVFSYTHRRTDVTDKYFVRVDVTEEFPFLVTKLSPFYEH